MANETLLTNVSGIVDDISAESVYVFNQLAGILDCVKHISTLGQQGTTLDFPVWYSGGQVASSSVNAGTEGTDYTTYVQMTAADTAAAIDEHQINAWISDLAMMGASPRNLIVEGTSKLFANGILAKCEDDVVNLFADFDANNDVAGAGTTLSNIHFADALRLLSYNGSPISPGSCCAVLSGKQIYHTSKGIAVTSVDFDQSANAIGAEVLAKGFIGRLMGVDIKMSHEIDEDVASLGDAAGAIMNKGAIGLHSKGFFNVEIERNASARGFELVCVGRWKEVEVLDDFGCYALSDVA